MLIEHLPPAIVRALPEIALLLIGMFVERHYRSRVSVMTNSLALTVHYQSLTSPTGIFTFYVELGFLLGIYGFVQYLRGVSIGKAFYVFNFYFYSSLVIGAIIFLPLHPLLSLIGALLIQFAMVVWKGSVGYWAYTGSRPADIQWFIENNSITYPNYRIGKNVTVPLSNIYD